MIVISYIPFEIYIVINSVLPALENSRTSKTPETAETLALKAILKRKTKPTTEYTEYFNVSSEAMVTEVSSNIWISCIFYIHSYEKDNLFQRLLLTYYYNVYIFFFKDIEM